MKRKIIAFISFLISIMTLVSCNDVKIENIIPINPGDISLPSTIPSQDESTELPSFVPSESDEEVVEPSIDESIDEPSTDFSIDEDTPSTSDEPENLIYTVKVIYNKKAFDLDDDIQAIWTNGRSLYKSDFNEEGISSISDLDGEYSVYLSAIPNKYTYDPNAYKVNKDNPDVVIELEMITTFRRNQGTGKDLYNAYQITSEGFYRAEIKKVDQIVYFEYAPKAPGVYIVESLVNIYEDEINPKLDVHHGSTEYKNPSVDEIVDAGGASLAEGYTKNFQWQVKIAAEQIGSVFTFGVKAKSKIDSAKINVDFKIKYLTEYEYMGIVSTKITPQDDRVLNGTAVTSEYSSSDYTYYNADGGTGNYYSQEGGTPIENSILDGTKFIYSEADGYWHYLSEDGPILCAAIDTPCAYFEEALNKIESHGNKNLTVNKGTENYKEFIELYYTNFSNSNGVCYVTMELKEFLQKYSVSQSLVSDGYGMIELQGTNAKEEDQWLFACGYYLPKQ